MTLHISSVCLPSLNNGIQKMSGTSAWLSKLSLVYRDCCPGFVYSSGWGLGNWVSILPS